MEKRQLNKQVSEIGRLLPMPLFAVAKTARGQLVSRRLYKLSQVSGLLSTQTPTEHQYLVLNPVSPAFTGLKPGLDSITTARLLMLDFDPLVPAPLEAQLLSAITNTLESLSGTPLHYPVNSGRGLQVWIPLPENSLTIPEAQLLVKGLVNYLREEMATSLSECGYMLDPSCAELSHLARFPGSINPKTGRRAHFLDARGTEPISLSVLDKIKAQPVHVMEPTSLPPTSSPWYTDAILNALGTNNRAFINYGTSSARESRHVRAWSAAKQLKDSGCDADLAAYLLWQGAEKCEPSLNLSDPGYIKRLVKELWTP